MRVSAQHFETFERMHWVCFHYEFEHDARGEGVDPDEDCGVAGCPSAPMTFDATAPGERPYVVQLEPEGTAYEVDRDNGLRLAFAPSPSGSRVEVSWTEEALLIHRAVDADATVATQDGRPLAW